MSVTTPLGALTPLPRTIWVPIALIGFLICGLFWTNEQAVNAVHEQGDHIASLLTFQSKVLEFRNVVVDAETGQRGYLLTNNAEYLQPYRDSIQRLVNILPAFRSAAAGSPEMTQLVTSMEILQSKKLAELATTIALASDGDRPQALAIVRHNNGQHLMTEFRDAADRIFHRIAELVDVARRSQAQILGQISLYWRHHGDSFVGDSTTGAAITRQSSEATGVGADQCRTASSGAAILGRRPVA